MVTPTLGQGSRHADVHCRKCSDKLLGTTRFKTNRERRQVSAQLREAHYETPGHLRRNPKGEWWRRVTA